MNKRKKIVLVSHEREINGASHSLIGLVDSLINKCDFIIITPYKNGPFVDEIKKRNVVIYYVPFYRWVEVKDSTFNDKQKKWRKIDRINNKLAKQMKNILKNEKIDIIHSNTSVVDFGYRLSKIMKVPHVWHIREFSEDDFSMYPLCSYKKYFHDISDNNYLVCVSKEVKKKFVNYVDSNYIKVIYNGVSINNINDNKKYHLKKNDELICIQSGAILKSKGQDITIKAIDSLVEKGLKIKLLLAGSGNLEDLGIDIKDKDWLILLGQVNNLNEIRKDVDIEIVSSKKEAFGRVTIEAMMGAICLIGSDSGATKELVKDGDTGILYKQGDYVDLSKKIEFLYNNREKIKEIGQNAYNETKSYYLIDRCANEVYDLYNKIKEV